MQLGGSSGSIIVFLIHSQSSMSEFLYVLTGHATESSIKFYKVCVSDRLGSADYGFEHCISLT